MINATTIQFCYKQKKKSSQAVDLNIYFYFEILEMKLIFWIQNNSQFELKTKIQYSFLAAEEITKANKNQILNSNPL